MPKALIEVSDIYDTFHQIANLLWTRFELRGRIDGGKLGMSFDDALDEIEFKLFCAACARRVARVTGTEVPPGQIFDMLRLTDTEGKLLEGDARTYHSTAFDWGKPDDEVVANEVVGGDLLPKSREDVRIFVEVPSAS